MPVARPESSETRVIAHLDLDCFYVQGDTSIPRHLMMLVILFLVFLSNI